MTNSHPYRGLTKRLTVLCEIGRVGVALSEIPPPSPDDPLPIGYRRILEARTVRDLLAEPDITSKVAKETSEFRKNFASFDLVANEGYLLSLVAAKLTIQKILLISSLGRFQTLFNLAKLRAKGVLVFESAMDLDGTQSRRRP